MNRSLKLRRACAVGLLSLSAGVGISPRQAMAQSTWAPPAAGTYDYFNAANWDIPPLGTASEVINFGNVITGDQTVNLNAATTLGVLNLNAAAANFTLAAGTGGTLTLDNAGTAQINVTGGATAYTISAPVTLTNPVVVAHNGTGVLTMNGGIGGAGGITKNGTGALTLSGTNTYTGTVTLNAGTLNLNSASALGTVAGGLTVTSGTLANTSGAAITLGTAEPMLWNGNFAFTSTAGTGDLNMGAGAVIMNAARTITVTNAGSNLTVGGGITGATFGITKAGAGTLTLNGIIGTTTGTITVSAGTLTLGGANTFTGLVTLTAGQLNINNNAALGTVAGGLTIAGGVLSNTSGAARALSTAEPLNLNGNFAFTSTATTGDLNLGAGAVTLSAARTITVTNAGSTLTIGGAVSGATFGITKAGAGSLVLSGVVGTTTGTVVVSDGNLTLSGANTYTGATTINGGTLTVGAAAPSGAAGALGNATSAINLGNTSGTANASLVSSGAFTIARNINVRAGNSGIATIGGTGANASVFSGTVTLNKSASLTAVASGTATFSGVISGAGSLTKVGAGTVVLSGANTFTGTPTVIDAGTLQINNNAGLSASTVSIGNLSTGRLAINGGVALPTANSITIGTGVVGTAGTGLLTTAGTGRGVVNGPITINAIPTNGSVFSSVNTTVGNELVINGAISGGSPGVGMGQRGGRVVYAGGGTITGLFQIFDGTALVGATDGLPTGLNVAVASAAAGTLDLATEGTSGFNQTIGSLSLGSAVVGNNVAGNVVLGGRTLTLNGDLSVTSDAAHTIKNTITGTTGGAIDFGATPRNINVPNTASDNELVVTGTNLLGTGPITKAGTGALVLRNSTVANTLNIAAGTLSPSDSSLPESGTLTTGSLNFSGGTFLRMKVGAGGDLINGGQVTAATPLGTTVNLTQFGGALSIGVYDLITYTGTTPGTGGFVLGTPPGRIAGGLIDTGTAIALNVTGNDTVTWTGTTNGVWDINTTANWKLTSTPGAVNYLEGDDLIFDNSGINTTITGTAMVNPSKLTFANTVLTPYTIESGTTIAGTASLNKTGNGVVTLRNVNTFTGAVTVGAGTLELDHDAPGNVVLTAASGVSVAAGATLRLTRDDGVFTFSRNISGAGTVEINPRTVGPGTGVLALGVNGDNSGFAGTLRLLSPAFGTYRITSVAPSALGTAAIEVQSGAQLFTAANQTYNNAINIAGTGYADANGNIGSLRLEGGSVWAGPVTIAAGGARIGAHNSTATISGNITGGNLELNATNYNNSYTIILTGTNSYGATVIGGQNIQTGGVPSMRVNVGNGGTTGTLGTGPVTIHGDGANGVLGFDRSDGYNLTQTITAASGAGTIANSITRTFIDVDTLGTGLNTNGNAITLGTPAAGGQIRVAQSRAGAIFNVNSAVSSGILLVGASQLGTANLNNGAVVNANSVRVALGTTASTGSVLNINNGASLTAVTNLFAGEFAGSGGTINQAAGSTVSVGGQLRVSHFGTNTSTYNMSGGSLTLTGASPTLTPSTSGAGGAGAAGDNNIEGAATAVIMGGGIYIGIDGQGIFNHTGGTVTTNWIVLDNRGNSGAGANMADGIDRYNISGSAVLNLRSNWGLIAGNVSTDVNFGGGTIRVDNTGTGFGTGANLTVPLNAVISTVPATTTVLDTNGAGNGFTLPRDITGTGTINVTGGGTINIGNATLQTISAALTGSNPLTKISAGSTTLTGNLAGFNGPISVNAGRLNLPSGVGTPSTVTVAAGAAIGGEPTSLSSLTLNGSTVFFDPNTAGALTTGTLTVNGANLIDLTASPTGAGPYTVINYTAPLVGAGTFAVANPGNYRVAPTVNNTGSAITLDITGTKSLTWTGTASGVWNINSAVNWTDGVNPETFYSLDSVTFPEGGLNPAAVTPTGLIAPSSITVNAATTNYTVTSTAGNQIVGGTGLTKTGGSTLTLVGPNLYTGQTSIGGGVISIAAPTSLGDGSVTNNIAISGGGALTMTAAMDLGVNRSVAVGTGGGTLSYNAAAGGTVTVPGNLTSAAGNTLSLHSAAAGGGTFALTGNNAGFLGTISIDAQSTGLTNLLLASNASTPGGGAININYPAAGANGNANGLTLQNVTLPASVAVNMTTLQSGGTISLRTQIVNVAGGNSAVDGPITVAGDAVAQFTLPSGTLTLNGNVSAGVGGFTGTFFIRGGGGVGTLNGVVNLPAASVSKTDAGTWVINSTGNNWLSSAVAVGTLRLGVANALPPAVALTMGQNDTNTATLDLNGFSQTVGSLASSPTTPGANSTGKAITSATAATLTINQTATTSYASLITGALSVTKQGSGTLTFAGANTYAGTTTITGGSLRVNGTHVGGGSYNISTAGTLGGSGTITLLAAATNQVLVSAGGTLAPGNSPGILSIVNATAGTGAASTLALATGSTMSVELNGLTPGTQYDQVKVTGTVDITGSALAVTTGFTPSITDQFIIIDNDGTDAVTGSLFASVNGVPLVSNGNGTWTTSTIDLSGYFYTVNYSGGDGNDVVLTGIPEPTSTAVLALAGLGLLSRRRRRA